MQDPVILLVEDNVDDRDLTLRTLARIKTPCQVVVASDGVEALDLLWGRAGRARIDATLILLDLRLPRLDGLGTLRALRGDPRSWLVPVIVLTSSKEEQDLLASYNLGANTFIRKPVDQVKLCAALRPLSLFWLMANDAPQAVLE